MSVILDSDNKSQVDSVLYVILAKINIIYYQKGQVLVKQQWQCSQSLF